MKTMDYFRLAFIFAILTVGGGFIAIWVGIWFTRGSYLTAGLCLGASLLLFSLLFHLAYPLTGAAVPRTEYGPEGTTVRPQIYADVIFAGGLSIGVSSAIAYLLFSQFDMVDYVPSGITRNIITAGSAFYVIFGVPALWRMFKYRDGSHLRLDPNGFEVWDGQWNSFAHGEWGEVEQILDHPLNGKKSFSKTIVFVLPDGRSAKLVSGTITADDDALREWARFYWQHPEYRDELTDGRALQRLDDGKFTL